jgi:hypothetical protein
MLGTVPTVSVPQHGRQALIHLHPPAKRPSDQILNLVGSALLAMFLTYPLLRYHKKCGEKEKGFLCAVCRRQFKTSSHLVYHMRSVHTGERPFPCPSCDRSFCQVYTVTLKILQPIWCTISALSTPGSGPSPALPVTGPFVR